MMALRTRESSLYFSRRVELLPADLETFRARLQEIIDARFGGMVVTCELTGRVNGDGETEYRVAIDEIGGST